MARSWSPFPYPDPRFVYSPDSLKKAWPDLHRGDCEPLPKQAAALEAWIAFHAGNFQKAAELGRKAGGAGLAATHKATVIYATYLEPDDGRQLALFEEVAQSTEAQQRNDPDNANAFYLHAYALGRYAQGISVVKALAAGIGGKVKNSLEAAIRLAPRHADAHAALGAYHAEVIDKVGALIGGLTYGAKKDIGLTHFETALKLNPGSAIARIEQANGLVMLEGKKALARAEKLYAEAAACAAADAAERLDVERAKSELAD